MPLVAVSLIVSALLQAGALGIVTLVQSVVGTPAPSTAVVIESNNRPDPSVMAARWVAPHLGTRLWNSSAPNAQELGTAHQWAPLQVVGQAESGRLPVWDPASRQNGWVTALDVGPVDPALIGTGLLPPVGRPVAWGGPARITMYTCVELGGCAHTASGLWPEPGMVAVDPKVIPLGSTVWIQGLGTFLAADTGSLVRGAHLDVYGLNYQEAIAWGVQERTVLVFPPVQ